MAPRYLTGDKVAINDFLDKFDTFLFDCDGVLWSGDHVFRGIPQTLSLLRSKGKQTIFVTNNSTKSRQAYAEKLANLGIPSTPDDVFGSSYSAAVYIKRILKLPPGKKVFVIGESGIEAELASEGVPFVGGTDASFRRDVTSDDFARLADGSALDPDVAVVLCGLDFHMNYLKTVTAMHYIRARGARFLATNLDTTLPMHHTLFLGAGSVAAPLSAATGQQPLVLGKPSQAMMDAVEDRFQLDRARTCMVGDRLDTDIKFGTDGKLGGTLHVSTGVNTKEDWEREGAVAVPTFYADKLSDLLAS